MSNPVWDSMYSPEHLEDEPCEGCDSKPTVHHGHGSYVCRSCWEARWCPKCRYQLGANHVCPTPAEVAQRKTDERRTMASLGDDDALNSYETELAALRASLDEWRTRALLAEMWKKGAEPSLATYQKLIELIGDLRRGRVAVDSSVRALAAETLLGELRIRIGRLLDGLRRCTASCGRPAIYVGPDTAHCAEHREEGDEETPLTRPMLDLNEWLQVTK